MPGLFERMGKRTETLVTNEVNEIVTTVAGYVEQRDTLVCVEKMITMPSKNPIFTLDILDIMKGAQDCDIENLFAWYDTSFNMRFQGETVEHLFGFGVGLCGAERCAKCGLPVIRLNVEGKLTTRPLTDFGARSVFAKGDGAIILNYHPVSHIDSGGRNNLYLHRHATGYDRLYSSMGAGFLSGTWFSKGAQNNLQSIMNMHCNAYGAIKALRQISGNITADVAKERVDVF